MIIFILVLFAAVAAADPCVFPAPDTASYTLSFNVQDLVSQTVAASPQSGPLWTLSTDNGVVSPRGAGTSALRQPTIPSGSSDFGSFYQLPSTSSLSVSFTVSLWTYWDSTSATSNLNTVLIGNGASFSVMRTANERVQVVFAADAPLVCNPLQDINSRLSPEAWHHVLVSYRNDQRLLRLFVNGTLCVARVVAARVSAIWQLFIQTQPSAPLFLGASPGATQSGDVETAGGYYSALRVWQSALNPFDIRAVARHELSLCIQNPRVFYTKSREVCFFKHAVFHESLIVAPTVSNETCGEFTYSNDFVTCNVTNGVTTCSAPNANSTLASSTPSSAANRRLMEWVVDSDKKCQPGNNYMPNGHGFRQPPWAPAGGDETKEHWCEGFLNSFVLGIDDPGSKVDCTNPVHTGFYICSQGWKMNACAMISTCMKIAKYHPAAAAIRLEQVHSASAKLFRSLNEDTASVNALLLDNSYQLKQLSDSVAILGSSVSTLSSTFFNYVQSKSQDAMYPWWHRIHLYNLALMKERGKVLPDSKWYMNHDSPPPTIPDELRYVTSRKMLLYGLRRFASQAPHHCEQYYVQDRSRYKSDNFTESGRDELYHQFTLYRIEVNRTCDLLAVDEIVMEQLNGQGANADQRPVGCQDRVLVKRARPKYMCRDWGVTARIQAGVPSNTPLDISLRSTFVNLGDDRFYAYQDEPTTDNSNLHEYKNIMWGMSHGCAWKFKGGPYKGLQWNADCKPGNCTNGVLDPKHRYNKQAYFRARPWGTEYSSGPADWAAENGVSSVEACLYIAALMQEAKNINTNAFRGDPGIDFDIDPEPLEYTDIATATAGLGSIFVVNDAKVLTNLFRADFTQDIPMGMNRTNPEYPFRSPGPANEVVRIWPRTEDYGNKTIRTESCSSQFSPILVLPHWRHTQNEFNLTIPSLRNWTGFFESLGGYINNFSLEPYRDTSIPEKDFFCDPTLASPRVCGNSHVTYYYQSGNPASTNYVPTSTFSMDPDAFSFAMIEPGVQNLGDNNLGFNRLRVDLCQHNVLSISRMLSQSVHDEIVNKTSYIQLNNAASLAAIAAKPPPRIAPIQPKFDIPSYQVNFKCNVLDSARFINYDDFACGVELTGLNTPVFQDTQVSNTSLFMDLYQWPKRLFVDEQTLLAYNTESFVYECSPSSLDREEYRRCTGELDRSQGLVEAEVVGEYDEQRQGFTPSSQITKIFELPTTAQSVCSLICDSKQCFASDAHNSTVFNVLYSNGTRVECTVCPIINAIYIARDQFVCQRFVNKQYDAVVSVTSSSDTAGTITVESMLNAIAAARQAAEDSKEIALTTRKNMLDIILQGEALRTQIDQRVADINNFANLLNKPPFPPLVTYTPDSGGAGAGGGGSSSSSSSSEDDGINLSGVTSVVVYFLFAIVGIIVLNALFEYYGKKKREDSYRVQNNNNNNN